MITPVIVGERCVCEQCVNGFYTEQLKKNEISRNENRIDINGSCHPYSIIVSDRVDLRKYVRCVIEDIHTCRIAQQRKKVKDDSPGVSGLDRILLAIAHTPQAILAVVFPVRARIFLSLHDDRVVRTGFGAEFASDAVVVGKHHLPHEKSADQEIQRQE